MHGIRLTRALPVATPLTGRRRPVTISTHVMANPTARGLYREAYERDSRGGILDYLDVL
jgi:hypothetical protein